MAPATMSSRSTLASVKGEEMGTLPEKGKGGRLQEGWLTGATSPEAAKNRSGHAL